MLPGRRHRIARGLVGTGAALLLTLGTAACGDDEAAKTSGDKIDVVAAFYPLQFLSERIGGDRVTVTNLVKPGAEPHDLELTPQQLGRVGDAGLVVYLRGFQPAVDDAVDGEAKDAAFDAAEVSPLRDAPEGGEEEPEDGGKPHANEGKDPHVWLDPDRFAAIADRLAERLGKVDPANATVFQERAATLRRELTALDGDFSSGLAKCQRKEVVTSHAAFGYLTDRYRLVQIPISGLSPEDEPSPQRVTEVADLARRNGVTTIFFETLVSPKISETLAREVGAKAEVLDPIEGIEAGSDDDYFSVMRDNLARLKTALGCT